MTARDNLKRLAEELHGRPPHDPASPRMGIAREWFAATTPEAILALIAEIEELERKVERLIRASAAVADAGLQAEELYKGRSGSGSALWREYEESVAALQADQGSE